ncbi:hypothetical protein BRADI_2g26338v3 [Brachypodium distachyon]|uniref:Uncharacterized protein n=1 Tax=Brachypodium distachyon TaxID=15368 RepID=A0A0Q3G518_BRADI|nr:hypothetical protein BRADI_2g26338v3 [Brachypodium distachyon]
MAVISCGLAPLGLRRVGFRRGKTGSDGSVGWCVFPGVLLLLSCPCGGSGRDLPCFASAQPPPRRPPMRRHPPPERRHHSAPVRLHPAATPIRPCTRHPDAPQCAATPSRSAAATPPKCASTPPPPPSAPAPPPTPPPPGAPPPRRLSAAAAAVALTGALVWAGASLLLQLVLISASIFAAAVKYSFVAALL